MVVVQGDRYSTWRIPPMYFRLPSDSIPDSGTKCLREVNDMYGSSRAFDGFHYLVQLKRFSHKPGAQTPGSALF